MLHGSGEEEIEFRYENKKKGNKWHWKHTFEGILPNMERRYQETESNAVREELGKYQSVQSCQTCGGTRLNEAARNVFVQDRSLPAINGMSVTDALEFMAALNLKGWRGGLVSSAHTAEDVEWTVDAWRKSLRALRDEGEILAKSGTKPTATA